MHTHGQADAQANLSAVLVAITATDWAPCVSAEGAITIARSSQGGGSSFSLARRVSLCARFAQHLRPRCKLADEFFGLPSQ